MLLMLIPNHLLESSIKELNSLPYKQLNRFPPFFYIVVMNVKNRLTGHFYVV